MQPTMNDWQRLDELLERGLDYYGRQLVAEAIQCWREVLYLSPGHRLALEYLEAAGASPEPGDELAASPPPRPSVGRARTKDDSARSSSRDGKDEPGRAATEEQPLSLESLSTLTVELIRERKFEEALALLYTAHGEAPRDPSISRSISVVKQRLLREYRTELGDPSQVPALAYDETLIEELPLSEDERELVPLIDGIVALEDVLQSCGLGALQAHRALAQLIRRRVIVLAPAAEKAATAADRADRADRATGPAPGQEARPAPGQEARPAPTLKLVPPPAPEPPPPTPVAGPAVVPIPGTARATAAAAPTNAVAAVASGAVHLPVNDVRSKTLPISAAPPRPDNRPAPPAPSPAEPPKPSRYAAHVAEAVRAHLQGHDARARELLQLCFQECPDEPTARRTLERLQQRLAAGGDRSDRKDQR